jgi:hypothetical protein
MQVLSKSAKPSSIFVWTNRDTFENVMLDFGSFHMRLAQLPAASASRVFMECEGRLADLLRQCPEPGR